MPLLMTQKEYAAHRKVSAPAVSNWKAKGLLAFAEDPDRPGKQLVDVARSDLLVNGTIDPTRGRPRAADQADAGGEVSTGELIAETKAATTRGVTPLEAERLEEMRERTRSRRIANEAQLGGLVSLAEYERRASDLGRLIRERTQSLIRQHSERMAAETDARTIVAVLGEAFDQLFNQVADDIEAEATREREVDQVLAPLADDDEGDDAP